MSEPEKVITWRGKPITELTREELLEALQDCYDMYNFADKRAVEVRDLIKNMLTLSAHRGKVGP